MATPVTIDTYINTFPAPVQKVLQQMRAIIRKAVPKDSVEAISYGIPVFKWNDTNVIHFAAFKNHIGLYPGAYGIEMFAKEISAYQTSKGTVQFPLGEPLPARLITTITLWRVEQVKEKLAAKKKPAATGLPDKLAAPARRALESKGIKTLKKLATFREAELLALHGFGKASLPVLREALKKEKLAFKKGLSAE